WSPDHVLTPSFDDSARLRSPFVHRPAHSLGTMRGVRILGAAAIVLAAVAAAPHKAKVHGFELSGAITGLDNGKKTLTVQTPSGKPTKLSWTSATTIAGGPLAVGQSVALRYLDKDGKHIVTSIRVGRGDKTPTVAASVSPTAVPTVAGNKH